MFARICFGVASLLAFFACVEGTNPTASEPTFRVLPASAKESFSQDAKGLEKEFEPFLKALEKEDTPAMEEAFKILALPDPNGWFDAYFKKEDVEQMGWDYEPELAREKQSLITFTRMVSRGQRMRFHAHCKSHTGEPPNGMPPRSDSMMPTKPVPVEQFEIEISADQNHRFSFLANFVYVDGAYRYLGKGAYPFWSMPDATRAKQ